MLLILLLDQGFLVWLLLLVVVELELDELGSDELLEVSLLFDELGSTVLLDGSLLLDELLDELLEKTLLEETIELIDELELELELLDDELDELSSLSLSAVVAPGEPARYNSLTPLTYLT